VKRRLMYLLLALVVALVAVEGSVWANVQERILYISPGSTLIAYGGDKVNPTLLPMKSFPKAPKALMMKPLAQTTRTLSDNNSQAYGDGYVDTYFNSTVYEGAGWKVWAEVEGNAVTSWSGTQPQYYSSKIKLDESWTFNGISVSVSSGGGIGFSTSGNTVCWSGEDDSGTSWSLNNSYSGIYGESWVALTSVRQSVMGTHYFESTHHYVSTMATDGCPG